MKLRLHTPLRKQNSNFRLVLSLVKVVKIDHRTHTDLQSVIKNEINE